MISSMNYNPQVRGQGAEGYMYQTPQLNFQKSVDIGNHSKCCFLTRIAYKILAGVHSRVPCFPSN